MFSQYKLRKVKKDRVSRNPNYRIITLESPSSLASEAYRRIKVGLEFSNVDKKIKIIQVCSATQAEGKTTTLLNIAATYLEDGYKVCCVDLDLRRPKLHRSIKKANEKGLCDYLLGNVSLDEAIKHGDNGLDILNCGTKPNNPTSILGSKSLEETFEELKNRYDIILVDSAPILAVSDGVIISRLCDGCIFVVSQLVTNKYGAKEAVNILKQNGVNLLGAAFVEVNKKNSGYYYNKYQYYYKTEE